MLELAEASFRSSALGMDLDPGPVEVPLVDLLGSLSMGTGRNRKTLSEVKIFRKLCFILFPFTQETRVFLACPFSFVVFFCAQCVCDVIRNRG